MHHKCGESRVQTPMHEKGSQNGWDQAFKKGVIHINVLYHSGILATLSIVGYCS